MDPGPKPVRLSVYSGHPDGSRLVPYSRGADFRSSRRMSQKMPDPSSVQPTDHHRSLIAAKPLQVRRAHGDLLRTTMKRVSTPSNDPPQKRTKASQACSSCRKQKSRCEILDISRPPGAPASIRCHRCKVLGVECSFETSDLIHFFPQTLSHTSPSASSPSSSAPAPSPSQSEPSPVPVGESYGGLNTLANVASSRPNVMEAPVNPIRINPIRNQYGMLPEDLVPTATTPVWGCVSRVDWTATPMLAIQELIRCPRTQDSDPQLPSGSRLSDILSPPEISSMLEMFVLCKSYAYVPIDLCFRFETRYTPWLCAQIGPLDSRNSLLDIVRCTIASRHLLPATRSSIAPRLQKLTEEVFLREIFNPQPSPESIRALLILSVWTPICGTGVEARDGRLLIASAVSMAMNLHLQDESKRASGLRTEKHSLSSDKAAELNESTQRWRLVGYLSSLVCQVLNCALPVDVSLNIRVDVHPFSLPFIPLANVYQVVYRDRPQSSLSAFGARSRLDQYFCNAPFYPSRYPRFSPQHYRKAIQYS